MEWTIISVLNQNYPNLEYIVIDGGSTDGSIDIIKKYDRYLTSWVSEPDHSQSDALIKGFNKTTGEILAWLNSDDMYLPGALLKVADSYRNNNDAVLFYGDYIKIDNSNRCIALRRQPTFDFNVCLYAYTIAMQPASFFNRKAFFKVGGINCFYNYVMDYDLILGLARFGKVIHIIDYIAAFRIHEDTKTMQRIKNKLPMESKGMRLKYINRKPIIGEMFLLRIYHTIRILLRMFKEGCIASRLGKGNGTYELNRVYNPYFYSSHEEF